MNSRALLRQNFESEKNPSSLLNSCNLFILDDIRKLIVNNAVQNKQDVNAQDQGASDVEEYLGNLSFYLCESKRNQKINFHIIMRKDGRKFLLEFKHLKNW